MRRRSVANPAGCEAPFGDHSQQTNWLVMRRYRHRVPKVIVVSGTLGAGKTFTADALRDVLVDRGVRCGTIDVDWLCQNDPAPADDRFNDRLGFANLTAVWPNYAATGTEYLALARVVEDPEDRMRYEAAFPDCTVRIVRVDAAPETCARRLRRRMPAGPWRDAHLARTDELAERLRVLALEDLVVVNESQPGTELASEILDGLDW